MKHTDLIAGPVGIGNHQPGPYNVEGGIDMHRVGIFETDCVNVVVATKMTFHPLNAKVIGHLHEKIHVYIDHLAERSKGRRESKACF